MKNIVLIKLGGSVITDKNKPYTVRIEIIRQLAREIKKANIPVVIFHGSGSFGHTSASKYGGKKGYKNVLGISKVARDAMEINRIVMDIFVEENLPAVSLRPMALLTTKEGKVKKKNFEPIKLSLKQGLIPVLYGDVIWDEKWKSTIYSGEKLTFEVAKFLVKNNYKTKFVVQVGGTDGVLKDNKTIPCISEKDYKEIKKYIFDSKNNDVTGGMEHKIEESIRLTKIGVKTHIINGMVKNNLYKLLKGDVYRSTLIK